MSAVLATPAHPPSPMTASSRSVVTMAQEEARFTPRADAAHEARWLPLWRGRAGGAAAGQALVAPPPPTRYFLAGNR